MNKKSVFFLTHDTSRTGAPIILLNFLKWLKENTNIDFNLLINHNESGRSDLREDFNEVCTTLDYNYSPIIKVRGPLTNAVNHYLTESFFIKSHYDNLRSKIESLNIGLVYSNTITNARLLEFLSFLDCPVITHVHELDFSINSIIGSDNLNIIKQYTSRYIVVSKAVKDSLATKYLIPEGKIDVVYGFIPEYEEIKNNPQQNRRKVLEELEIPDNSFVVGASGSTIWRKAPDLFIQLANAVNKLKPDVPVHFVWVGGENSGTRFEELWYDVTKLGLQNNVHFIGVRDNPLPYYEAFDVFALVSREDPFPLVMLEAASLGKPILCFDNSGGAIEFINNDCGFVAPYMDIDYMANKIFMLINDSGIREKTGEAAAQKSSKYHKIDYSAPKILNIINSFLR